MERPARILPGFLIALLVFGLAIALFLWRCLSEGVTPSIPLDDGWIHLSFAQNLAAGEGFRFGANPESVGGSTAPLWTMLLSVPMALGLDGVTSSIFLGLLFGVLSLLTTAMLGAKLSGNTLGGVIAAVGLALAPRYIWGALSGMEVPLFTFLVTLGVWLHLRRRPAGLGAFVCTLAGWARPECFAIGALLAAHDAWRWRKETKQPLIRWVSTGSLAFLGCLGAWIALHYALHGKPLPTTFYVKAASGTPIQVFERDGLSGLIDALIWNPAAMMIALLGYIPLWNPFLCAGVLFAFLRQQTRRPAVLVMGIFVFFGVVRGLVGFGVPWVQHGRYYAFLYPLVLAISAAGLATPSERKGSPWPGILVHSCIFVLCVAVLCPGFGIALGSPESLRGLAGYFLFDDIDPAVARSVMGRAAELLPWLIYLPAGLWCMYMGLAVALGRGRSTQGVLLTLGVVWAGFAMAPMAKSYAFNVKETTQAHVGMGRWIAENTAEDAIIACHDIGAIGYWGDRRVLDLAGIVTTEILDWPKRRTTIHSGGLHGDVPDRHDYILQRRPDYLCLLDGWYSEDVKLLAEDWQKGRLRVEVAHTIDMAENVTLGGKVYQLFRLRWD